MTTDRDRPRVLYLTHHLPWPAFSGGRLREAELLRRLAGDFDIELVAVSKTVQLDRSHLDEARQAGVQARIFPAGLSSARNLSPHVRRHQSPEAARYLAGRLAVPDRTLVHVEGHYLFGLLPKQVHGRTLIVEHNIESALFEQEAEIRADPRERAALLAAAESTRRTEQACWEAARLIAAVTEEDAAVIRRRVLDQAVPVIPGGADHLLASAAARPRPQDAGELVFVGNFGYSPNVDAARLIITEILPRIRSRCPDVTMSLVGPAPPRWLRDAAEADPRLNVTGFVPDMARYLDAAQVVLCPLRIGGGVKIKVLEGVARGRAVVTTPVGMQGLHHLPAGATIECDGVGLMIEASVRLLRSPADRQAQELRASLAAMHLPTWSDSARLLASIWQGLAVVSLPAALAES